MTTYTAIPDANLDPDSPARSIDALALRDNPIAITEGASGAPRVASDLAVDWDTGGVGATAAKNWVLAKTAAATAGAVGTYSFAVPTTGAASYAFGATIAGGSLARAGVYPTVESLSQGILSTSGTLSGSWRCMGYAPFGAPDIPASAPAGDHATLWLRIS
jgi:hypothetical protein